MKNKFLKTVSKQTTIRSIVSVILFIFVWQILSGLNIIDTTFIGQPINIITSGYRILGDTKFYPYLFSSAQALIYGFTLAVIFSIPLGIVFGSSLKIFAYFKPYLYALNSVPKIVILPLILLWFGIGLIPKVIFIIIVASIPILVNTIEGVRSVDKKLLEMGKSFEFSNWKIGKDILFYSSWPFIYSGIKIAFGRSVTNLLIAEMYGLGLGLGYLVSLYGATYQINKLLFVILLLIIFNFSILALLDKIENMIFKSKGIRKEMGNYEEK